MRSTQKSRSVAKSKALARMAIFGPPPVLLGEDERAYETLFRGVASGLNPTSFIEQIWIVDIADLTWEIIRLRKIKARLISDKVPDVLETLIEPEMRNHSDVAARKLVRKWMAGDPKAKARVEKILIETDSTIDSVYGQALVKDFNHIERIDEMITVIERRRNTVFHEIDRHRDFFSRGLRDNVKEIENAEYREITETDSPKITVEDPVA